MQEFESISASSYDPSALATKLTAKAAEGWTVVAIVPTGGDVTAFVTRERDGDDANDKEKESAAPASAATSTPAKAVDVIEAETLSVESITPKPEPEPAPKPEPVSEPSGWAIAPEPAAPTPEPASPSPAAATLPTTTAGPAGGIVPGAAAAAAAAAQPAASQPAVSQPAAVAPTAARAPEPAPTPTVPAGWYADPAGRYELRYWDGGTWTEHVSRAGQQFTDPPVA